MKNRISDVVALFVLITGAVTVIAFFCLLTCNRNVENEINDCSAIYVSSVECIENTGKNKEENSVTVFSPYERLYGYLDRLIGGKYD